MALVGDTLSLVASVDGAHLYEGVGSNSNAAENGMEVEHMRAAILEVDAATGATRVFASGLRNPVGLHGSWNRRPLNGYQVVFVPFTGGRPAGPMRVVLSGFLDADGNARGRPVGVSLDGRGGLLVADDVGNSVWRVTPARDLSGRPPGQ